MRYAAASIFTLCLLGGCERSAPPQAAPAKPAAAAPVPTAPLSPTIARLVEIQDGLPISRESAAELTMYVAPREPGLVLSEAPAGEHERVLASLRVIAPSIQSLITLSGQPLGTLPPWPAEDASLDLKLAHPVGRLLTFTRLLIIDAARCWDEKDYNGAAERITATLRWAHDMLQPDAESWIRFRGQQCLGVALARLDAQTVAGLATRLDASHRARMLEALAALDAADPTRALATWERDARGNAAWVREHLSGSDAGEKLAALIQARGANTDDFDLPDMPRGLQIGGVLVRRDLDKVRVMSAATIAGHLVAAEAMIGPVAAAMRSPDALVALKPLQAQAAADPSQVARVVLGAPAAAAYNSGIVAKLLSDCRERLAKEAK
jgi:hypothetical protein